MPHLRTRNITIAEKITYRDLKTHSGIPNRDLKSLTGIHHLLNTATEKTTYLRSLKFITILSTANITATWKCTFLKAVILFDSPKVPKAQEKIFLQLLAYPAPPGIQIVSPLSHPR